MLSTGFCLRPTWQGAFMSNSPFSELCGKLALDFTTVVSCPSGLMTPIGSGTCRRKRQQFRKLAWCATHVLPGIRILNHGAFPVYSGCLLVIFHRLLLQDAGARHIFACKHTSQVGPVAGADACDGTEPPLSALLADVRDTELVPASRLPAPRYWNRPPTATWTGSYILRARISRSTMSVRNNRSGGSAAPSYGSGTCARRMGLATGGAPSRRVYGPLPAEARFAEMQPWCHPLHVLVTRSLAPSRLMGRC